LAVQPRFGGNGAGRESPCLQQCFQGPVGRHGAKDGVVTQT
jgi:hypothetical protein